jgi:phosphate-selective porin OprO/OprP
VRTDGRFWAAAFVGTQLAVWPLAAQETNTVEIIRQLQQRIGELEEKVKTLERSQGAMGATNPSPAQMEELDQKVRILERERELDEEAAAARAMEAPKLTVGEEGFSFSSANGAFGMRLGGLLQVDSRTFFDDGGIVGNDSILLRRARPYLHGTVFRDFDFLFLADFGGASGARIIDAFVNYRYSPPLQLQAGIFRTPVGLERLQNERDLLFNERALPTDLAPVGDLGIMLHGDLFEGVATYALGIFNGVGDDSSSNNADVEDDKAFAGRLFSQPFKKTSASALRGFGFGVGGSYQNIEGTNTALLPANIGGSLPGYATAGQQQFFAYNPAFVSSGANKPGVVAEGNHWRVSPQGYYYYGPFGLLGEYAISDQQVARIGAPPFTSAHLSHRAWQVAASWLLTGEAATYGTVVPRRPFSPAKGDWGAWQLAARYSELDIDPASFPLYSDPTTSARRAQEFSVGLNWYLNRNVRVDLSYSHTSFEGGGGSGASAPAIITRQAEQVLFTRVQLAF